MHNEIIGKLNILLNRPIDNECQVVYLLVQTRKALDHEKVKSTALRFYCSWALHIDLENSQVQEFFENIHPGLSWGAVDRKLIQSAHAQLTLQAFRTELHSFLNRNSLNADLCVNDSHWNLFLEQYSRVVQDCPLIIKRQIPLKTNINLKTSGNTQKPMEVIVKSLCIESIPDNDPAFSNQPLPMRWSIKYQIKETESMAKGSLSIFRNGTIVRKFSI